MGKPTISRAADPTMTRTEALLPCPFCGSSDLEQAYLDTIRKWGFIRCRNCGAQAGDVRTSYEPEPEWFDAAAAEWNRRVLPDPAERGDLADVPGHIRYAMVNAMAAEAVSEMLAAERGERDGDEWEKLIKRVRP